MPDILVRHIDAAMAERIKLLARQRQWSLNDVILHALRFGLGLSGETLGGGGDADDPHNVAHLAGTWGSAEVQAFDDAVAALGEAPDGLFAHLDAAEPDPEDAA